MRVAFRVNGDDVVMETEPDRRVVDLLRQHLQLTGVKECCGAGECGACTILVDGVSRLSCLMLAAQLEARELLTIEGLNKNGEYHAVQQAFIECGAVQCGFCTPGMVLATLDLLHRQPQPTERQIREGLSGNLCRCTGYQKVVEAVAHAAKVLQSVTKCLDARSDEDYAASRIRGTQASNRRSNNEDERFVTDCGDAAMKVLSPSTLSELWAMLDAYPEAKIMAGGTDILVQMLNSRWRPTALLLLEHVDELKQLDADQEGMYIGAMVTCQQLLESELVSTKFNALHQALAVLGSPPVRHAATLGGNLCTASPAGDTIPPLTIYGAQVEICSAAGRRVIPIAEFIQGPGKNALAPGELLTRIIIPWAANGTKSFFYKIGKRKAMAIAVASLAVSVRQENGRIQSIRLAWGSVGPTVLTLPDVELSLSGRELSETGLRQAGELAAAGVSPIDDIRASAAYRRQVAGNLLLRLLEPGNKEGEHV